MFCLQSQMYKGSAERYTMVILTFVPLYRKQYVNIDMYSSMQVYFKMK